MIYLQLFLSFAKIGVLGFGGGLAMLPIIFQTSADLGYVTAEQFSDLVAISQVTPGPLAVNAATYVGYSSGSFLGALAATLGVALPSFAMVITVSFFMETFKESKLVKALLMGIRPVTIGLIGGAALFITKGLAKDFDWILGGIFFLSLILSLKFKTNPFVIMVVAAILGALLL